MMLGQYEYLMVTGPWASSCMGIALGAGFYECMIVAFPLILLCFRVLPLVENHISAYSTDMNVYVEFERMELLDDIFAAVRQMGYRSMMLRSTMGRKTTAICQVRYFPFV